MIASRPARGRSTAQSELGEQSGSKRAVPLSKGVERFLEQVGAGLIWLGPKCVGMSPGCVPASGQRELLMPAARPCDLSDAAERLPRRFGVARQALRVAQAEKQLDVPRISALPSSFQHASGRCVVDSCLLVRGH